MYLKNLEIESLGSLKGRVLDNLTPGVNAIIGDNGTGKSTARAAISFSLFGIPSAKGKDGITSAYFNAGNTLRRVHATITNGEQVVKITRETTDKKESGPAFFQPTAHEDIFSEYIGDVSREDFLNIWSTSESDVNEIDPEKSGTLQTFLSSHYGLLEAPSQVNKSLSSEIKNAESTNANSDSLALAIKKYKELDAEYQSLSKRSKEAIDASLQLNSLTQLKAKKEELLNEINFQRDAINTAHAKHVVLSSDLEKTTEEISSLEAELAELCSNEPEQPAKPILNKAAEIESDSRNVNEYRSKLAELENLSVKRAEITEQLKAYPQTSFSFTEEDCDQIAADAEKYYERISEATYDLSHKRELCEQKVHQLEELNAIREQAQPANKAWGRIFAILGTAVCFIGSALYALIGAGSTMLAIILGCVGLLTIALELIALSRSKNSESLNSDSLAKKRFIEEIAQDKANVTAAENILALAEKEWSEFITKNFPAHAEESREDMRKHIRNLPTKLKLEREQKRLAEEYTRKKQTAMAQKQSFQYLYQVCFPESEPAPESDIAFLIGECKQRLEEERTKENAYQSFLKRRDELNSSIVEGRERHKDIQTQLASIAHQFNVPIEELSETLSNQIQASDLELAELRNEMSQINHSLGSYQQVIKSCVSQEELDQKQVEKQELLGIINAKSHEYYVALYAQTLLSTTQDVFDKTKTPAISKLATEIFHRITQGKYVKVLFTPKDSGMSISVIDNEGNESIPDVLSLGTMRQLYLAIRFAVIKSQGNDKKHIPIVLDEILSSFDEDKREAAVREINEIAKDHQVFYFSVRNDFQDNAIAKDWNYISLNND